MHYKHVNSPIKSVLFYPFPFLGQHCISLCPSRRKILPKSKEWIFPPYILHLAHTHASGSHAQPVHVYYITVSWASCHHCLLNWLTVEHPPVYSLIFQEFPHTLTLTVPSTITHFQRRTILCISLQFSHLDLFFVQLKCIFKESPKKFLGHQFSESFVQVNTLAGKRVLCLQQMQFYIFLSSSDGPAQPARPVKC